MNLQFFADLPPEITVDILSRLSVRDVAICKCVCKQWLHLLQTSDFINLHLSKSVPGLAIMSKFNGKLSIFEFNNETRRQFFERHELRYSPITNLDCRSFADITLEDEYLTIKGSANGLLLLFKGINNSLPCNVLYICNPITREYIKLPWQERLKESYSTTITYGFGVTKLTGQYKVVSISHKPFFNRRKSPKLLCEVYTLGTGSWRSIISPSPLLEYSDSNGIFLNGNLHWLIGNDSCLISCLDLETEVFTTFSLPPTFPVANRYIGNMVALMDCLCIYGVPSDDADEIVIWLMKEYGDEKSWTKEFVISNIQISDFGARSYHFICPIKVFEDGDILMMCRRAQPFYYSTETKTSARISTLGLKKNSYPIKAMIHTSSLLSLKSLIESTCCEPPVRMMTSNQDSDETDDSTVDDEDFEEEQLALDDEFFDDFYDFSLVEGKKKKERS